MLEDRSNRWTRRTRAPNALDEIRCQIFCLHAGPIFATRNPVGLVPEKNPGEITIVIHDRHRRFNPAIKKLEPFGHRGKTTREEIHGPLMVWFFDGCRLILKHVCGTCSDEEVV